MDVVEEGEFPEEDVEDKIRAVARVADPVVVKVEAEVEDKAAKDS